MDKSILGISAFYHDSAAALVVGGKIVAAAQEERFSRIKHDHNFPEKAIEYCLQEAGLSPEDLDFVTFYEKPFLKFDRLLETYFAYAPLGLKSFVSIIPSWLKQKLHLSKEIKKGLGGGYKKRIVFPSHHESHAASAFFPSPFPEAAILTIDGVGEWETSTIGKGKDNRIEILKSLHFPHSLGLLYSAFSYFTGFRVNSGEYKLMGLAPYGNPKYKDVILNELLDLKEDGSFAMDMDFFNYCQGLTMTNDRFAKLFDGPPRKSESDISEREMDLAASVQVVTEEIVLRMARYAKDITGMNNLCLAGGVALNCVANGKLLREKIFDQIWIQPAAGDAGGALGAAIFVHHQLLEAERIVNPVDSMQGSLLGPRHQNKDIKKFLEAEKIPHHYYENEEDLLDNVAGAISSEKVVGWFQGRMEYGPRALGARSILGDPRNKMMQSKMNLQIKFRESFRPFAPSVLKDDANTYFKFEQDSPYMMMVATVQESQQTEISQDDHEKMNDPNLIERVNIKRSTIPAVTHVDLSARIQTVDENRNRRYYHLIKRFKEKTGCGVLINTSFNIRGEPIVCTPEDAYKCFMTTDIDMLVIENFILLKTEQSPEAIEKFTTHRENFIPD